MVNDQLQSGKVGKGSSFQGSVLACVINISINLCLICQANVEKGECINTLLKSTEEDCAQTYRKAGQYKQVAIIRIKDICFVLLPNSV